MPLFDIENKEMLKIVTYPQVIKKCVVVYGYGSILRN
jgi:hypothetical protein